MRKQRFTTVNLQIPECFIELREYFVTEQFPWAFFVIYQLYILESISCKFAGDKEIFRGDAIYENSCISFTGENM